MSLVTHQKDSGKCHFPLDIRLGSLVKSPVKSKHWGGPLIFAKDHKTRDMFDPLARFGRHRKSRLERSWAKLFREEILPELPVHKLRPFYAESKGAPTKDLYAMLGIALLQQMHDLTDEETVDQVGFNLKWDYALNPSEENGGCARGA